MNKEEIVNLLIKSFSNVYCDTCENLGTHEESCEVCHRKNMMWSIDPNFAKSITEEICKGDN